MEQFLLMVFAIIGLIATLIKLNQWVDGGLNPKPEDLVIKKEKQPKQKVVGSFNNKIDESYDKLIYNIVTKGNPFKIDEYSLYFEYQNKEYKVWIANKDCAYGNDLSCKNSSLVKSRGITQFTANELYKKELAFIELNGKVPTQKEKEDAFISFMLEDN